jgi:hypothetical protein
LVALRAVWGWDDYRLGFTSYRLCSLGYEYGAFGPVEVWGRADFPKSGLWDVHGIFRTEAMYANGVKMVVTNEIANGIRFEGTEGWIFVSRGDASVTSSTQLPNNKLPRR